MNLKIRIFGIYIHITTKYKWRIVYLNEINTNHMVCVFYKSGKNRLCLASISHAQIPNINEGKKYYKSDQMQAKEI